MPINKTTEKYAPSDFAHKIFWTLFCILCAYLIIFIGTLIRNNLLRYSFIGKADSQERTLNLQADGKVTAKPDVALTTMGMIAEGATVAEAQQKNTTVMNNLISKLKALGIAEADIQTTNYNIYPQYAYSDKDGRKLTGYEVNQSVTIKIRNLVKANDVIALAGEVGANNVSGLQFTVDDPEVYKAEARKLALDKIKEKMKSLSAALGVTFVSVVSYDESSNDYSPMAKMYATDSMGGGAAPQIQTGENDVTAHVNITFEIR